MGACRVAPLLVAAVLAGLGACGDAGSAQPAPVRATTAAPVSAPAPGPSVTVVATADIACPPERAPSAYQCRQAATAALARRLRPVAALLPGDLQYEDAAPQEWAAFDASWGRAGVALHPAPGNHEYNTAGARGYYDYFGARAGPDRRGWYAFDLGRWRAYALNSNCDAAPCGAGGAQAAWLRADLAAHPRRCVLAFWHHPRFSSGLHGDTPAMRPIWQVLQDARADLVLQGHDHDYERFDRRTAAGRVKPAGIASFVVGVGGRSQYPALRREPGSARIVMGRYGVLVLGLRPDGWSWRLRTIDGATPDRGSARCR